MTTYKDINNIQYGTITLENKSPTTYGSSRSFTLSHVTGFAKTFPIYNYWHILHTVACLGYHIYLIIHLCNFEF